MDTYRSYLEFIRMPILFYKTIGEELYEHRSVNVLRSALFKVYFYWGFIQFNLLVLGEIIYFVKAVGSASTLLEATAVVPCIGFSLVADFKQVALATNKRTLRDHLDQLEELFPGDLAQQLAFKLPHYELRMKRAMLVFTVLCLAYTSTFSLYPACKAALQYFVLGAPRFDKNFGFLIWYPYDTTGSWLVYWLTYLSQVHGAYLAGIAFLSADLLIVTSVTQLCMHFNRIAQQLEQFDVVAATEAESEDFAKRLVAYHAKCLDLCEHVNDIFSISLLLNFLTASLTICFIGFQVTASTTEDIVKYCIFLLASLLQVFIVCYYGDELMSASLSVSEGAYNQNWYEGGSRYKRILLLVMVRSQRVASMRAPTFPPISLATYMKVIGMSYQFFALLRTTYYGN